ncbi:Uncharacterized membrane protein YoaK, UPF0700 family [Bosea sp. OK403]|nr:Uncharacterized membrane protein YoaK, UPF0700 family [Bosea sp. OK403]
MLSARETRPPISHRLADHLRSTVAVERSAIGDLRLAEVLCFIAGATNAGGFLAVGQYTSHMSGIVSSIADNVVLGSFALVGVALLALAAFLAGAGLSAILINWGRRNHKSARFAYPLFVEAVLLLCFGLSGHFFNGTATFIAVAIPLLCFIMGLQNAMVTKISNARMRTTHVTGMVTDLGIELGKLVYVNIAPEKHPRVVASRKKLRMLATLIGLFLFGGIVGAVGFKQIGYITTVPLAIALVVLAGFPVILTRSKPPQDEG